MTYRLNTPNSPKFPLPRTKIAAAAFGAAMFAAGLYATHAIRQISDCTPHAAVDDSRSFSRFA